MNSKIIITPDQLKQNPKKIGNLKGQPVYYLLSKGGLSLIMAKSVLGTRVLGTANHPAVARFIAKEQEPSVVFDELSKSEDLPLVTFKHLLPFYREYTKEVEVRLNGS
jgi:hypothetical protein